MTRGRPLPRGMSLIELMVAVAVFVILALLAAPVYQTWVASQQVRSTTESIVDGLKLAQTEAIRRNAPVRFELDPGTGWRIELVDDDSLVREGLFAEGGPKVSLTVDPAGTDTVRFDGLGRPRDKDGDPFASRVTVDVDTSTSLTGVRALRVVIDTAAATGVGIRSCDPKLSTGDPRACPA